MAFELPEYSRLNPQQVDMINLPTSRNFMIKGSPGTGKTVVAIYRAAQMRNKKVLMLVYNRPLMLYLRSAIEDMNLSNCTVNTYHSWMTDFYRLELTNMSMIGLKSYLTVKTYRHTMIM